MGSDRLHHPRDHSSPVQRGNARKGAPRGGTLGFPRENPVVKCGPSEGCWVQGPLAEALNNARGSGQQRAQRRKAEKMSKQPSGRAAWASG